MEYVKLKNITTKITKGTTPSNINAEFTESGINYFRSEMLGKSKYLDKSDGILFISKETHEKLKRSHIKENDILFSMAGAYLGKLVIVSKDDIPANTNQAVAIIRFIDNINIDYVYYFMSQKSFTTYVNCMSAQAAQPNINLKQIGNLQIAFPNHDIQTKIASVLSTYDDLIETNNKRIKLLEQMAENLYKEWFVRFRFPNFEQYKTKDSSLGRIPECFNVVKINTLVDYYIGGGWGSDKPNDQFCEEAYVVRGTDFPHFKIGKLDTCPLRYHKTSNFNARALRENDIVLEVSGGTQDQPVGRSILITKKQLNRLHNRLICASFCKQIRCNSDKISPRYLYYWLQYMYETRMIDKFQLQSTGIINFKFEYFMRKCDVILPPFEIMKKFDLIVEPLYTEIDIIAQQNENLIKQRDFLLPRLMSGKLEVE